MINESTNIQPGSVITHIDTGMVYVVICVTDKFKLDTEWVTDPVIVYQRFRNPTNKVPERFGRFKSDMVGTFKIGE